MFSRKLTILVIAALMLLSTVASAALPPLNLEAARELLKRGERPEKVEVNLDELEINEQVNVTGPKASVPGSIIVRLNTAATISSAGGSFEEAVAGMGGEIENKLDMAQSGELAGPSSSSPVRFAFLKFPDDVDVEKTIEELEKLSSVLYAEPNYIFYPDALVIPPTDTYFANGWQYYLYNNGRPYVYISSYAGTPGSDIKAVPAWNYAITDFGLDSSSVVVGVIDQGVCFWIPELGPNMWINEGEYNVDEVPGVSGEGIDDDGNGYIDDIFGYDFTRNLGINFYDSGYFPWMEDPHGTHVAGTISSAWNGSGVAGASRNAKIMSLKFLGAEGGSTDDAIRALAYAAENGADFTTNSWGGGEPSQALSDAIKAAGKLFVTSAGNDGNNNDFFGHYPSSYSNPDSPYYCENIISVAATDANDNLSAYSCYGEKSVHIAAPGTFILAPIPANNQGNLAYAYSWYTGTSMATPLVSSVAAMLIAQDKATPGYSLPQYSDPDPAGDWDTVKEIILNSAEKKAQLEGYISTGARLNMYNALTWQRLPSVASIEASTTFSNEAPIDVEVSVVLEGGAAASSVSSNIEHRWYLTQQDAWWAPYDVSTEPVVGETATITIPEYGDYKIRYEMYDVDNDMVVTTSYKHVLVAEPEAVLLALDDQWYGYEDMSWVDEYALLMWQIPYYYIYPPLDIPSNVPNVVFWTTTYTTSGVINEEDALWIIDYLKNGGGRLFLASYEMLNMVDGYYGESGLSPETAAELLEVLKIDDYITDHTYAVSGDMPLYEPMVNVEGDSIAWAYDLSLDLEYDVWYGSISNFGDVVTGFGPGAYPILLSTYGGEIDTPERAAYGLSYAGEDYRLVFLGAPLEAMQGLDFASYVLDPTYESNGDMLNFLYFVASSYEFLLGEGPDRLVTWLDSPETGVTYSNIGFEWGLYDEATATHNASLWYRADAASDWQPVTLSVPGEDLEYAWTETPEQAGTQYQVKIEMRDAADPNRVAYDFAGPFAFWPVSTTKGASAGVDRANGLVNFNVNAAKPGTLYVYDLSGVQLFSHNVEPGLSTVTWDMMFRGKRVARGLYAFRVVYEDGTGSEIGRVLINF